MAAFNIWDVLTRAAKREGVGLIELLTPFEVQCGWCGGDITISHSDPGDDHDRVVIIVEKHQCTDDAG